MIKYNEPPPRFTDEETTRLRYVQHDVAVFIDGRPVDNVFLRGRIFAQGGDVKDISRIMWKVNRKLAKELGGRFVDVDNHPISLVFDSPEELTANLLAHSDEGLREIFMRGYMEGLENVR